MLSKLLTVCSPALFMLQHFAKMTQAAVVNECHSKTCHPIDEYCSQFEQTCMPCRSACDPQDIKYEPSVCSRECSDFIKLEPLKNEIYFLQMKQNVILILLIVLLTIAIGHFAWKLIKCLKHKHCLGQLLQKVKFKKDSTASMAHSNGKGLGGTTITNLNAINDVERAPSQIYSLRGVEGSVMTVTTPISSRHPAENTTPSPQPNEYSYDNQGLVVTPVSEKPNGDVF